MHNCDACNISELDEPVRLYIDGSVICDDCAEELALGEDQLA